MQNRAIYGFQTVIEAEEWMEQNNIEGEVKETCQGTFKIIRS